MFEKVLIANRGEIACRVIKTCARLGVGTVAVYSDADSNARHVRLADEAVRIGPAAATESYLDVDRLMAAAASTGCAAIHPGYGFLSESAGLARACAAAGIAFVGPGPETIDRMGSKSAARRLMEAAGVPVVPGYHGDDQTDATLIREAGRIGYPVLVKASAGGGGKGMRIAGNEDDIAAALAGARREASSAFGDDRLLLERFLRGPRHIEFQVFGTAAGEVLHLFERECSIQRRYQKIVEETPSPFLDDELRAEMARAAVAAARAVNYTNAGTVEFIVGNDRGFFFMEMNTRLQVEHPVTEFVTGVDLVEWQLLTAAGEPVPLRQEEIVSRGHAIEARLYAERPHDGFLPSTGQVDAFVRPADDTHVRIDTGIEDGDEVSIHYDPMVAKLIVHDVDRGAALTRLRRALAATAVQGLETNAGLLRLIAGHPDFAAARMDTAYIDTHLDALLAADPVPGADIAAAAAAGVMTDRQTEVDETRYPSPWSLADGWQANGRSLNRLRFRTAAGASLDVSVTGRNGAYRAAAGEEFFDVTARREPGGATTVQVFGGAKGQRSVSVWRDGNHVLVGDRSHGFELTAVPLYAVHAAADDEETHPGSPMPGRIVALEVEQGQTVTTGQALIVLEGMKMEFTVRARRDGVVARILYGVGDLVDAEVPLVDIDTAADGPDPAAVEPGRAGGD